MPRQTELYKDVEGIGTMGVHVKLDRSSMPYTVATFDHREQLSSWKAALQSDDEVLFAKGVLAGKNGEQGENW